MELRQVEAFLEVSSKKSFVRAAEALHVTQPSLSARIKTLEEELGLLLFDRISKGVRLTDAGKAFTPHAEKALEALKEGRNALKGISNASLGKLNIGTARVIGTYVLPKILKTFRSSYPGVDLAIRTGRSTQVLQMLLDDTVDVGLTRSLQHPQVESIHLYDEEIVLVTYPSHPFASAKEVDIEAVGREPLILYDKESTYYVLISNVCRQAGIVPKVVMDLDSIEATKKMVEQGMGVSFLPRSSLDVEIAQGTLTVVKLSGGARVVLPTALLYRKGRETSAIMQAFFQIIRQMYEVPFTVDAKKGQPNTKGKGISR